MASRCLLDGHVEVNYARIPITAERPPDYSDITELMDVVVKNSSSETPIVVNCQLGRGRSTLTAVCVIYQIWATYVLTLRWLLQIILVLIQRWLGNTISLKTPLTPRMPLRSVTSTSLNTLDSMENYDTEKFHHSYQIINSKTSHSCQS